MKSICLLANDNPFLLEGFSQGLSPHFDLVITAQNGQEAVDIVMNYHQSYFSAIILDIEMPVMDGMQACIIIEKYLKDIVDNSISSVEGSSKSSEKGD